MSAAWELWSSYPKEFQERIIQAFCEGAYFQLAQPPPWKYVENFNREYARCKYQLAYSNTVSPIVHDEVQRRVPEVKNALQGVLL